MTAVVIALIAAVTLLRIGSYWRDVQLARTDHEAWLRSETDADS